MKSLIKTCAGLGIIITMLPGNVFAAQFYGTYEQLGWDETFGKCASGQLPDGLYPVPTDPSLFMICASKRASLMRCGNEQVYWPTTKACSWTIDWSDSHIIKCNTLPAAGLCDCRDNPDFNNRSGTCSCHSNGYGLDYSKCSPSAPCPEFKDINGVSYRTYRQPPNGDCGVQPKPDILFPDSGGIFEFVSSPDMPFPPACFWED